MFFVVSPPFVVLTLFLAVPTFASRRNNIQSVSIRSNLLSSGTTVARPIKSSTSLYQYDLPKSLKFLEEEYDDKDEYHKVEQCSSTLAPTTLAKKNSGLAKNLLRGAFLRVASDLSGGTPLESIKCRSTVTLDGPIGAFRNIVREKGFFGLWTGTPSRTVEGALLGAIFMLGSATTKKYMLGIGATRAQASLAAGLVGGLAQSVVMTPAAMIFTSLHISNKNMQGVEVHTMRMHGP